MELFDFVNISSEKQKLLFAVTVVSYYVPEVPHVVFTLYGPQGSGKTFAMRAARSVIDPSLMTTMTLPRDQREFVQQLFHNYFAPYDNVGSLPFWMSDILCRAVTGTGVSKRRLYTDEEDVIFSYFRCVGLTGINIAPSRGDLLERSLLIGLEAISEKSRRTEEELNTLLEEKRPKIFGGVLNTLARAMGYYPHIEVDGLFRMADYTKWGAAITEALDVDMGVFLKAYKENIAEQYLEAIKVNPVAEVLLAFLESRPDQSWEGSPTALHGNLCETAELMKVSTRQRAWPKNAAVLGRRLNEIAPSLPYAGYNMQYNRTVEGRIIVLNAVNADNPVKETRLL